MSSLNVVVTRL